MDYSTKTSSDSILDELVKSPERAREYDAAWKHLTERLYKKQKAIFWKIRTQEQWDAFYKTIPKKWLLTFNKITTNSKRPAIHDPKLWLYGPISQSPIIQQVIADHIVELAHGEHGKNKDAHASHPTAHAAAHDTTTDSTNDLVTTEVIGSKGVLDKRTLADIPQVTTTANKPVPPQQVIPISTPKTPLTPQAWIAGNTPSNNLGISSVKTPSQQPSSLLTEKPLHPQLRELEKEILRRTNADPSVLKAVREGKKQSVEEYWQARNQAFQRHSADIWGAFVQTNPALALQFATYAPIAHALQTRTTTQTKHPISPAVPSGSSPVYSSPAQNAAMPTQAIEYTPQASPQTVNYSLPPQPSPVSSAPYFVGASPTRVPTPSHGGGSTPSRPSFAPHPSAGPMGGGGPFGRGGGIPGIPNSLGGLAAAGVNALPGGIVVTAIWRKKKVLAALLIFVIFFFSNFTTSDTGELDVTITTGNTTVDNPPISSVQGAATSAASASYHEVLAESTSAQDAESSVVNFVEKVLAVLKSLNISLTDAIKSEITYTITTNYTGQAQDIILTYPIPPQGVLISATGNYTVSQTKVVAGQTVPAVIKWSLRANQGGTTNTTPAESTPSTTDSTGTGKVSMSTYAQSPYFLPAPSGNSDLQFSSTVIARENTLGGFVAKHQAYLIRKTKGPKYVNPFLSVIWNGAIEGIGGNQYFYNCYNNTATLNVGCDGYSSGNWQVGWGIQVSQAAPHIAADFDEVYGAESSGNATKVQQVGQRVIAGSGGKITYPRTFPTKNIPTLVSEASSNRDSRQALAILLMDDELGAVAVALEVAADIGGRDNWRASMEGWGSYYVNYMQLFSNRASALAKQYNGSVVNTGGTTELANSGVVSFPSQSFTVVILPMVRDKPFSSGKASAEAIGGVGGTSTTASSSASTTSSGAVSGDIKKLLPTSLPADPSGITSKKQSIVQHFKDNPRLITFYKEASSKTNIPWQVFAGMHWREGDALPGYSLTSGVRIGGFEPDRSAAGECNGPVGAVDGKADTNCAYANEIDDIMFAANHLIGKINKVPSSYQDIVQALSRYNGTSNENCGRSPYSHCPPTFTSEDSAYTLNYFDNKHGIMYMIYCSNNAPCGYGTQDGRPGAMTVTKWVSEAIQ